MDLSRWDRDDRHHGNGTLEAAAPATSATHPSRSLGFIPFPPSPSVPCPSGSNREVEDGGRTRIRERKRSAASAAADDRSTPVKEIKKRPPRSWKRVNLKRDNLADRIMELHELVSPLGKKDIASVLQEAGHYIQIQHQQLKALSTAHILPLPPSALQEREDMDTLRSRGLCLFPVCALPIDMLILLQSL